MVLGLIITADLTKFFIDNPSRLIINVLC